MLESLGWILDGCLVSQECYFMEGHTRTVIGSLILARSPDTGALTSAPVKLCRSQIETFRPD
jgi:hypothetical protein